MLITKSLLVCLRDPPGEMTLAATAAAWADVLGNVPVEDLQESYQRAWALPDHKPGFPVTADEILAGWREIKAKRDYQTKYFTRRATPSEFAQRQQVLEQRLQVVPVRDEEEVS